MIGQPRHVQPRRLTLQYNVLAAACFWQIAGSRLLKIPDALRRLLCYDTMLYDEKLIEHCRIHRMPRNGR